MSIAETKENIVILLENIIKRSETIEKQSGGKTLLEIDMVMDDIRLLYREMDRLRKLTEVESMENYPGLRDRNLASARNPTNHSPAQQTAHHEREHTPVAKPEPTTTEPIQAPEQPIQAQEKQGERAKETKATEEQKKSSAPLEKKSVTEIPNPEKKQEPVNKPAAKVEPIATPKGSPVSEKDTGMLVGEKYAPEKSSVHERLAQIKEDVSIGARMQSKPVSNIKEAIGLNEKFLFINELFNGDINAYNESINQLNSCESIHQAFEMLNNLTSDYNWDGKRSGETIDKFANLVQRRYM
jgi:hypothetical protein